MPDYTNRLKRTLAAGHLAPGMWITLESATLTEIAVMLGFEWVVIDIEHGHLDLREVVDHLRAARGGQTTVLVRIPQIEQGIIKRVLDVGAQGILIPQINSADEVERAVRFAKYPPWGVRGVGGERATSWSTRLADYTAVANDETMVLPIVETVAAGRAIDDILSVRGVDAIFFGPADFSSSAGHLGQWEGPGVAETILAIKDKIRARGLACGVMSRSVADALSRREQGFQMIGVGSDTGLLIRAASEGLKALGAGKREA